MLRARADNDPNGRGDRRSVSKKGSCAESAAADRLERSPAWSCKRTAAAARHGRSKPCPVGPPWRHSCVPSGGFPRGDNARGNRQRPYRRRSRSPSPPTISPNAALKPFGSISGTLEPLTGLATRKPPPLPDPLGRVGRVGRVDGIDGSAGAVGSFQSITLPVMSGESANAVGTETAPARIARRRQQVSRWRFNERFQGMDQVPRNDVTPGTGRQLPKW